MTPLCWDPIPLPTLTERRYSFRSAMKPLHWDAINPFTGTPFTFDDPNLKFVNGLGVYLEPGDPGFVPYPVSSPIQTQKPRKSTMPKSDYMPTDDEGKAKLFVLFRDNIGAQLAALGIAASDPDITQQAADATRFRAVVDFAGAMQQAAQSWTAEKNYERDGGSNAPATQAVPALPASFPAMVPPGIVPRFRTLVKRIKVIKSYIETIGQSVGIEGAVQTGPDMTTLQADFDAIIKGNSVFIGWDWGGNSAFLDMIRLEVDRGDGKGFQFLANDTTPGYLDGMPFPAAPTKWTYRAIYIVGDAQVGVWSKPVSITVGG